MQQGQQNFQNGKFAEASQFFSKATQIDPKKIEGWINLGIAQAETGNLENARSSLDRATSLNPDSMMAQMSLGDIHRLLGNWREAVASYAVAVSLQRTPITLNKLASAIRSMGKPEDSEALYEEALRLDRNFTLSIVNLAMVQAELHNYDEAKRQFPALKKLALSPALRQEVNSTDIALNQYYRVQPFLEAAVKEKNFEPLYKALSGIPKESLQVDNEALDLLHRHADSARDLPLSTETESLHLPEDWPLMEAYFTLPLKETVDEYCEIKEKLITEPNVTGDLQRLKDMEETIRAARLAQIEQHNPIKTEMYLRYWHALAMKNAAKVAPGHFKVTRNTVGSKNSPLSRTQPHLVTGTLRYFLNEIYIKLPPGLPRGLVAMLAIYNIHPFYDGNTRIAHTLLNRELEWAGQMPILISRNLGINEQHGHAFRKARISGGDISSFIPAINQAQEFTKDFIAKVNRKG